MRPPEHAGDIRRLRALHEAWCREWAQLHALTARYDPNQPRVASGSPDGGQWADSGFGGGGSLGDGQAGESNRDLVRPAFLRPRVRTSVEAALALFTAMSARNGPDTQAVIGFHREYAADARGEFGAEEPVVLTGDQVAEACPKLGTVQEETDRAAALVRGRDGIMPPAIHGTSVHTALKEQIKALGDPNLIAEQSFVKEREEVYYSMRGSIRIDVLENVGDGTVCVYDIKTGRRGLSARRAAEIVRNVQHNFQEHIALSSLRFALVHDHQSAG